MLRNTMTNTLTLFCLVDGDSAPFPVEIESTKTVGSLKDSIKLKKTPRFDDVAADELTLWSVSIPVSDDDDDEAPLYIDNILETDKKKLKATTKLSKVFGAVPEDTIHIIVQRPPPGKAFPLLYSGAWTYIHGYFFLLCSCQTLNLDYFIPCFCVILATPVHVPAHLLHESRPSSPYSVPDVSGESIERALLMLHRLPTVLQCCHLTSMK